MQWVWLTAGALFTACLLLDVVNVMNVQEIYMLLGSTLLLVSGWWIMPSMKEIEKAQRRRP